MNADGKIKALSIRQPWAEAILYGYKEFEFRTWPTKYRGPLLIHAPKNFDLEGLSHLRRYGGAALSLDIESYPRGTIIGSCVLTDCILVTDDQICLSLIAIGGAAGLYAFKLEKVKRAFAPIECSGRLGFWNPDKKTLEHAKSLGLLATDEHR